ncbi:MAG: class I SAM-dependent methyltransferase, partial [Myxococcales bacterium]|nr:class I SAM-dependent methyltransferase [Myxococcales bacterium]
MFDRIAPRYDRMNRLLTLGLDQRWRRDALARVDVGPGDLVVDVACGTGDLAELAAARGARVIATDFAAEMLR